MSSNIEEDSQILSTSFAEAAQFSREFLRAASVEYPSVPLDELSAFALACWEHKRDNTEASDSATLRLSIEGRKSSTSPPPCVISGSEFTPRVTVEPEAELKEFKPPDPEPVDFHSFSSRGPVDDIVTSPSSINITRSIGPTSQNKRSWTVEQVDELRRAVREIGPDYKKVREAADEGTYPL